MMADNIKASPQTLEQVGLTLTSKIQDGKLIIQGLMTKDGTQFIGQLNNNMDEQELEDIRFLIESKKVKLFPISDNLIKIKVGGKTIQLKSKPKPKQQDQNSNDTERIKKLMKTQSLMEIQIKKQNDELLQHKKLIDDLQKEIKSLKLTVKLQMSSYSSFKNSVANFMSSTKRRLNESESTFEEEQSELYQLVKNEKQSQKVDKLDDDKIEEMKKLIDQMRKQIIELKHNQEERITSSSKVKQVSQVQQTNVQEKIQQNTNIRQLIKLKIDKDIDEKFIKFHKGLDADENMIVSLRNQLTKLDNEIKKTVDEQDQKLTAYDNRITETQTKVNQQDQQLKNYESQLKKTITTVSEQSKQLKQYGKEKELIKVYLQSKVDSQKQKFLFLLSLQISRQNGPIRSIQWSKQLKSKGITINNNVVTLTKYTYYRQLCLLNASFSNTIKTKQLWAIKINNKTHLILLGVCLKSKMNYNFNSQNMNWYETGHGLYMIGSNGYCYSHSQNKFNHVQRIFHFGDNDVIYVEYDPFNLKLRFSKNKHEYFEMSIIAPPQYDAYYPCVSFNGQNQSVELLQL